MALWVWLLIIRKVWYTGSLESGCFRCLYQKYIFRVWYNQHSQKCKKNTMYVWITESLLWNTWWVETDQVQILSSLLFTLLYTQPKKKLLASLEAFYENTRGMDIWHKSTVGLMFHFFVMPLPTTLQTCIFFSPSHC